jgi:glycosyltransferase involved in cell wall biosynthesis
MNAAPGLRVLMLLENNAFPQDRRVAAEASALTQAGHRVTVIAPALPGQPWHEVENGVTTYRYPAPTSVTGIIGFVWEYSYSLAASFALSLLVFFRTGFDVVHAHNPPDLFVFIAAFYKLFGTRFVFDHHDLSPEMFGARFGGGRHTAIHRTIYRVLVWLEALSCRLADQVIATNESYAAVEAQRGRVPRDRITIVRNGPNLDIIRPVDPDPGLRRSGKTIIGYIGIMGVQDGVDGLLRALKHLIDDVGRTDFLCVLVGDGDAWPSLKVLAAELEIEAFVWFTGPLVHTDWLPYLCAADLCVEPGPSNPYNDRSTAVKIMEYMALSKPIVAFDLPEHRFTARDAACYVQPNDERAFAWALAQLMDDRERRETMGAFGRRRVESALAWPHSVTSLLRVYTGLLPDQRAAQWTAKL